MKTVVYAFMAAALLLVESSGLSLVPMEFFKPDLGIPFIVYTAVFIGPPAGLLVTLIVSILQEMLSASPAGSILLTKMSLFLVATFLRNKLYIDSQYSFAYVCSGSVVLESLLFLILSFVSKGELANATNVLYYMLPNAVFTGLCAFFIFSFIETLNVRYLERD